MGVEICANSLRSARNEEKACADRIELSAEWATYGLKQSYGVLKQVISKLSIPCVLIHPRSGDFCYSDEDFAIILNIIIRFKINYLS